MKKTRKLQTCKTVHLNQNEVVKIAPSKSQFWSQLESMESIFTRIFLGSNELFTRTVNKQVNKNLDDARKKYEIPSKLANKVVGLVWSFLWPLHLLDANHSVWDSLSLHQPVIAKLRNHLSIRIVTSMSLLMIWTFLVFGIFTWVTERIILTNDENKKRSKSKTKN